MNAVEILKRAKRRIENPRHWCVGANGRDRQGKSVFPWSPDACRWCAYGAIDAAELPHIRHALEYLDAAAFEVSGEIEDARVDLVNDHFGHAAVMKMYDLAIAKAEGET